MRVLRFECARRSAAAMPLAMNVSELVGSQILGLQRHGIISDDKGKVSRKLTVIVKKLLDSQSFWIGNDAGSNCSLGIPADRDLQCKAVNLHSVEGTRGSDDDGPSSASMYRILWWKQIHRGHNADTA